MESQTINPIAMTSTPTFEVNMLVAHPPQLTEAAAAAPAPALSLDQLLAILFDERCQRLAALRAENAAGRAAIMETCRNISERLASAQAARTADMASQGQAVANALNVLQETARKADLARLYAADSTSEAAEQVDVAADLAVRAAGASYEAENRKLAALISADESTKVAEAEALAQAEAQRDQALAELADALNTVESEYADVIEELERRATAQAEQDAERVRREKERQAKAEELIARASTASDSDRLEALLAEAREARVLHQVENTIRERRQELESAMKRAVAFARTLPQLPRNGSALALVTGRRVDVFVCDDTTWAPWKSWNIERDSCAEIDPYRKPFSRGDLYKLAARLGGKVIALTHRNRQRAS
jgi:hypothetical protein